MGVVRLPQRFLTLPQYEPQLADAYSDAEIFSLFNDGTGKDIAKGNDLAYPASPPTKILQPQGYALNFNGSQRLVSTNTFTIGNRFTVFAWVRPSFINYNYARIAESAYTTGFYLGSNNGNDLAAKYAFIVKGASLEGCIGGQQVIGQRDFVCGTYNGTNRTLYVNGEQVATATASAPSISDKVYIGHNSGGVNFWRGDIDTFAFYQRAFSAEEVQAIYQQPGRLFKAPPRRILVSAAASGSTGTVAYTNANDISSAAGTTTIVGSGSAINASDTSTASGNTTVKGSLATTNASDTVSASGSVGSTVSGAVAYTNNDDIADSSGTTSVTGSSATTNDGDTSSAAGTTTVTGTSATTNADDTATASGESDSTITGEVAYSNANDTASASGTTTIVGSVAATNVRDTSAASGIINNGIVVEAGLTTGIASAVRIKKPGIPAGTPDWLRTMLEILIGRRGNKIDAPKFRTLTFSATPTKAECEALYSYTNDVRTAVENIINRLDS